MALGTGMPTPITRAQKSSAWYVELGNGDIFLFDCGTGSVENLFTLRPDFARVDKIFASHIHTPPAAFGKIMSEVKPRLAVGYHAILVPDMHQGIIDSVRSTYDGPLAIANDLMCWNIRKENIVQREVIAAERVQPPPTTPAYMTAKRSGDASYSEFINSGKWKGYTPPPLPEGN
ncbi:MAG: hypothetical protein ACYTHJ_05915 [Planctomycetota bacterium]